MMELPKIYDKGFEKHIGKPKLSYSQYSSWKDPEYRKDYFKGYFLNLRTETNDYAKFGGEVGKFIELRAAGESYKSDILSPSDIEILESLPYPKNCKYEEEIVIDRGWYVIQGFVDRAEYYGRKTVGITDFKTGNIDKKTEFYSSKDYGQTTLYAYQKHLEGFKIGYSKVTMLGRKGNNRPGHPIRLSGDVVDIDTPYSKERAIELLEDFDRVAEEIKKYYNVFKKINK